MSLSGLTAAAFALAAVALIVPGCGGGSSSSSSSTGAGPEGKPTTVSATEVPELGEVLVDSKGFAVYALRQGPGDDVLLLRRLRRGLAAGNRQRCADGREGANSSEVGTTKRKDGSTQVTYAGHPLYTFVEDKNPGEANGNGVEAFGGVWNEIDESGSAPSTSAGESPGGGGY